jgi:hypothetical protein
MDEPPTRGAALGAPARADESMRRIMGAAPAIPSTTI